MDLHGTLDRRLPRAGYAQKIFLVALLATHVPLLAIVALAVLTPGELSRGPVLGVALVATLAGTAGLLGALHLLLEPMRAATAGLAGYLTGRVVPALPTGRGDDAGRLLDSVGEVCARLEAERLRLERVAAEDELTGLLNRRAGSAETARRAAQARELGEPLSLALVDLDHFKRVNDQHGHAVGDAALRLVADTLRENLRAEDCAARWGGEEILVVVHAGEADAAGALDRLRRALSRQTLPTGGGEVVRVSASIGVAELRPDETVEGCLQRADAALSAAKDGGRNQVRAATAPVSGAGSPGVAVPVPSPVPGGW